AALPVLADRVARLAPLTSPPPDGQAPPDVLDDLGRLYYDLAGVPLPRALPALLSLVPASQLVYGSDYPFTNAPTVAALATAIAETGVPDDAARAGALRGNAAALLPRLA